MGGYLRAIGATIEVEGSGGLKKQSLLTIPHTVKGRTSHQRIGSLVTCFLRVFVIISLS